MNIPVDHEEGSIETIQEGLGWSRKQKARTRPSFVAWLSDYIERSERLLINSFIAGITDFSGDNFPFWASVYVIIMTGLWLTFGAILDGIGVPPAMACSSGALLVIILTVYLFYLVDTTKAKRS